MHRSRRDFLKQFGVSAAAGQFLFSLPSLGWAASQAKKQRLIFVFSPNGVIPKHFWPDGDGEKLDLKRILKPLEPFQNQVLTLQGIDNKIKGDGDGHMRGIGCLLTGVELFPGDVQGGSDTPAGWSQGISVDQHLKNKLQADPVTQTRFGSLEFGVMVPDRADTWTRMSYGGPNQPVAPISDPYQMFDKLYGQTKNREMLASVLDDLSDEFRKVQSLVSSEDRRERSQDGDGKRRFRPCRRAAGVLARRARVAAECRGRKRQHAANQPHAVRPVGQQFCSRFRTNRFYPDHKQCGQREDAVA